MSDLQFYSFHPYSEQHREAQFRVMVFPLDQPQLMTDGKHYPVLGLACITDSETLPRVVPVFNYQGETIYGDLNWDSEKFNAELVVIPPELEGLEGSKYAWAVFEKRKKQRVELC